MNEFTQYMVTRLNDTKATCFNKLLERDYEPAKVEDLIEEILICRMLLQVVEKGGK